MKTITVTEQGTEEAHKLVVSNIKKFYSLTYNSGETVTIIDFVDGTEIHAKNPIEEVEKLIND